MKKGVLFLLFTVFILVLFNSLFFVYYSGRNSNEDKDVSYTSSDLDSGYYDSLSRESYDSNVIKLNADKTSLQENENSIKKISDKSSKKKSSSGGSSGGENNAKIFFSSSSAGKEEENNISSAENNSIYTAKASEAEAIYFSGENMSSSDINISSVERNDSLNISGSNFNVTFIDNNSDFNSSGDIQPETIIIKGSCKKDSKETNEGPGGDFCPFNTYEGCMDFRTESTAIAYNCDVFPVPKCYEAERGTDYCSDSHTLQEAYLDCGSSLLLSDGVGWTQKDCNDYDTTFSNNYCLPNSVQKRTYKNDYGCSATGGNVGECNYKQTVLSDVVVSQNGDADYCAKRKEGVDNGWAGCTLCKESDYDCDSNSECSEGLQCKGPVGDINANSYDGCCSADADWDSSLKSCCTPHSSYACFDNDVYWYNSCTIKENKAQECGDDSCSAFGSNYCKNGDVYKKRTCSDKGCSDNACFSQSSDDEQLVQDCDYDCSNGACISQPACFSNTDCGADGYIEDPFCSVNQLKQKYRTYTCNNPGTQSASCSHIDTFPIKDECKGSSCNSGEFLCKDGDVYETETCNNEVGCVGNSCKITTNMTDVKVYECGTAGCSNGQCNSCTTHAGFSCSEGDVFWYNSCNVKEDKKQECGSLSCNNGQCVSSCVNECSTSGVQQCSGSNLQTCGNYDSDSCLEWGGDLSCPNGCSNNQCQGGGQCTNECSFLGLSRCSTNTEEVCGYYDTDSCLEWGGSMSCVAGCSLETCSLPTSCSVNSDCGTDSYLGSNYCSMDDLYRNSINYFCLTGNRGCAAGTGAVKIQECGDDSCSAFGSNYCKGGDVFHNKTCVDRGCNINSCFANSGAVQEEKIQECGSNICSNGVCVFSCINECSTSGAKQCSGSNQQTCGNYDSDSCLEWGGNINCQYGCSNNICNQPPQCTNECNNSGQMKCESNIQSTCGNYDSDSCLEFGSAISCSNGCFGNTCSTQKQMTINLNSGTNLFSLPLVPSGGQVSFGNMNINCIVVNGGVSACSGNNIAYLNPDTKGYTCLGVNDNLYPGQGYFVRVLNACSLIIRGDDLGSNKIGYLGTSVIKKGENLIGAPTNTVIFSSVKNTCSAEDPLMFVYGATNCNSVPDYSGKSYCGFSSSGYNYCYCSVSKIIAGKGYNLYSGKECSFA